MLFPARIALLLAGALGCRGEPRAAGPLRHEAYVWQRAPDDAAVAAGRGDFAGLVALAVEVSQDGVTHVTPTPSLPETAGRAIRIEGAGVPAAAAVAGLAGPLCAAHPRAAEIQLDIDAASSRLPAYAALLREVQAGLACPLTFTALPDWLGRPGFAEMAAAVSPGGPGWVLQVHGLPDPQGESLALVEVAAARGWVERAAGYGRFRVALPTHRYQLAYDEAGAFLGLAAETADARPGVRTREAAADPAALVELLRGWEADRPAALAGVIWFRLPAPGDARNLPLTALRAVMAGRVPQPALRAEAARPAPGLVDARVCNGGEADAALAGVEVAVEGAVEVAEGLGAFRWQGGRLRGTPGAPPLPPGRCAPAGWARGESLEVRLVPAP